MMSTPTPVKKQVQQTMHHDAQDAQDDGRDHQE
jgi:hypothetical protein